MTSRGRRTFREGTAVAGGSARELKTIKLSERQLKYNYCPAIVDYQIPALESARPKAHVWVIAPHLGPDSVPGKNRCGEATAYAC